MIEGKNITKKYGEQKALNDVSFVIPEKKILGLLGPNGAGKTTLIRILTGIIKADAGVITIGGEFLNTLNSKRIGYLPEERGLYKKMRVGEQAVYFATLKGFSPNNAKTELKRWFNKLEISSWWDRKVEELSKGMQQKVQFIIAAIHQPDFLILDEPFSGLDPINAELLGNEILELNAKGTSIILSTHNMSSVEQFCEYVLLINKGEIILSGQVDEIKQAHKQLIYEFRFKENPDLLITRMEQANVKIVSAECKNNTHCIRARFSSEADAEAMLVNNIARIGLLSFTEILPSMNDIFIASITK